MHQYGDYDDDYCEDDVDWQAGDCDDEFEESAFTMDPPTDDPDLLEQFDGHLEDADASASPVFMKHVNFCLVSRVPEATFLLLACAFDGLAQPSTDRKPAKSRGKDEQSNRKEESSSHKSGKCPNLDTPGVLPKQPTSRSESRPPMSKKRPTEAGATRGGPHHAPRLRPGQCILCRQLGHRATECPNKKKSDCIFTWQTGIGYIRSGLCSVQCCVLWCRCQRNRTRSRRE